MKKKSNLEYVRLNKFIALSGHCTRRQADDLIIRGRVKVNKIICSKLGMKVKITDLVTVDKKKIIPEKNIYILLNKPKKFTTKKNTKGKDVLELLKKIEEKLFPVGDLDDDTSGLLLFTNDHELLEKFISQSFKLKTIYSVILDKPIGKSDIEIIKSGLIVGKQKISVEKIIRLENNNEVGIEIIGDENQIFKKIFKKINFKIIKLDRVMIGQLTKKDLPRGKWRSLKNDEARNLKSFLN
ncbi:MAG: pseudouridine synthase [Cytophagia bacterium]|jgi:23S rRNA pseudouridine2605 synthase|nr:pseudouridine synthase [Cytophagia bacterium]|tara:strand:- start:2642 stop:3361 length:720 start_codon:yes stop_codon:yes gene_type:complete